MSGSRFSIEQINALVAKYCPRKIHYWGNDAIMGETWVLDGITPVTRGTVIRILAEHGAIEIGDEIQWKNDFA